MSQLNQNNLVEVTFKDFSGGQASAKGETSLATNEFKELNNVVILPSGSGLRSKPGNTEFNSSAMSGGHPVMGIGYYEQVDDDYWLMAVCDNKVFKSDSFDGTMDDISGSLTITADQDNLWQIFTFNDLAIGVGGPLGAPNAPWKWSGTGNAAVLGGTPPSADFGFVFNNRLFLGVQSTDTLYWSAIRAPEDWSTSGDDGTGSAVIGKQDGGKLVAGVGLNTNTALIFKTNGVTVMAGRESPFSFFPLSGFPGCAGKNAAIVVDGMCYYVTPQKRMVITDGERVFDDRDFPRLSNVDDVWDDFDTDRLKFLQATEVRGRDFHWIVWSSTVAAVPGENSFAVIWDLKNKCFITASSGFESNGFVYIPDKGLYMAGYDGKIYKCLVEGTFTEASNGAAAPSWEVESDQLVLSSYIRGLQVQRANVLYRSRDDGEMTFSWGYDSSGTSKSTTMTPPGDVFGTSSLFGIAQFSSEKAVNQPVFTLGRGNTFKWKLSGSGELDYRIHGVSLYGKQSGTKQSGVR